MALSNIFREPRREITESIVGTTAVVVVVGGFGWLDYAVASASIEGVEHAPSLGLMMFALAFLMVAGGIILTMILVFTHAIGDVICDILEDRGLQVRPRQRY